MSKNTIQPQGEGIFAMRFATEAEVGRNHITSATPASGRDARHVRRERALCV